GLIPEFIGRLPVMSAVHQLTREDLVSILIEPRNALVKQFQRFFSFDGIELVFADDSLTAIAEKGLARETGARGLRSIVEEILLDRKSTRLNSSHLGISYAVFCLKKKKKKK